jgi:hypothetical protein
MLEPNVAARPDSSLSDDNEMPSENIAMSVCGLWIRNEHMETAVSLT